MNIYTYHFSLTDYIIEEKIEEKNQIIIKYDYVEIGPFKLPDSYTVKVIKDIISDIPSDSVISNWWIDFSSWEDFHGIFRTGTILSLHSVVSKIEEKLKLLKNCSANIEWIDENGNITIYLDEIFQDVQQNFKITARRKKLRRLEQIAALNVARQISCEADAEDLPLHRPLKKLIKMYLDTFSVDVQMSL